MKDQFQKVSVMSKNTEIIELIKALAVDVAATKTAIADLKEAVQASAAATELINKTTHAKLDIFKNLQAQSRETIESTSQKRPTKPAYFKKIFIEDRATYINKLYTEEEIKAAFADKGVMAKTKESEKLTKVANIIYTNHIKADNPTGRLSEFTSIFEKAYPN